MDEVGFFYHSPLHWVAMYGTQLLDVLFRPHIEIVVRATPSTRLSRGHL